MALSERTQAFVNLYAGIGVLEKYLELDESAKELAKQHNVAIRFKVKGGPDGVVDIKNGACKVYPYEEGVKTNVVLYFDSCDKFNRLVAGEKVMPIPTKGILKVLTLLAKPDQWFNVLTGDMAALMRKKEFDNDDEKKRSVTLAFYAMTLGAVVLGNEDSIAQWAMRATADGEVSLGIKDVVYSTIVKSGGKNGKFTAVLEKSQNPRSIMEFADIDTAGGVINGTLDAMTAVSTGRLETKGHMLMLDSFNKIAAILPRYLS